VRRASQDCELGCDYALCAISPRRLAIFLCLGSGLRFGIGIVWVICLGHNCRLLGEEYAGPCRGRGRGLGLGLGPDRDPLRGFGLAAAIGHD